MVKSKKNQSCLLKSIRDLVSIPFKNALLLSLINFNVSKSNGFGLNLKMRNFEFSIFDTHFLTLIHVFITNILTGWVCCHNLGTHPFFKKNNSKNKNTTHKQKRQRVNWKNLMTAFNTKTKLNNSKNKSKSLSKNAKNHSKNLKGGSLPSGGYDETTEFGPHMLDTDSGDAVVIGKVGDVFTPMSREVYEKEYKGEGFNIQEA